jgi:poly(A) polymerase
MLTIPRFSILKDVTIMDKASDIILQRQCAITNIPPRFISDIKEIWNMQITLENQNNLDNPKEIVWKGIFRASVDFLNARISVEPSLKEIADQWVAQYEFFVPPEMRSRKQIIERDKGNNTKKGGKKDKSASRSKKKFSSKDGYKNKKFRKSGKVNLKKAQEVLEK